MLGIVGLFGVIEGHAGNMKKTMLHALYGR